MGVEEAESKMGQVVSDFTIIDQNKNESCLRDLKGKKVLLSFHPLAWTAICAEQMKSLEANKGRFDELNTVALGVSVDTQPSKLAWAEHLGIEHTQLITDFWPHGEIAELMGVFKENKGISERANVIIDEDQRVAWVKVYEISTLPDVEEVIETLKTM